MPGIKKIHRVSHAACDMFDLVADVEKYPEFLPMCENLSIRSRQIIGERERIVADMSIGYKLIRETFTSQVSLDKPGLEIEVRYIDGPFRYLENNWKFNQWDEDISEINFAVDYEFKSRALGALMGNMFELVFSKFTAAFESRANEIYGRR